MISDQSVPQAGDSREYFSRVAGQWDEIRSGYFTEAMRNAAIAKASLPAGALVADMGPVAASSPRR
jgi:hypothetical protein